MLKIVVLFTFFIATDLAVAGGWKPVERIDAYAISGSTGPALYAAIGEKGPLIGTVRTIAHTTWELKWSRKYVPDGAACKLVSAKPFLIITTTLPKPTAKLANPTAQLWKTFIDGIVAHEKIHAADIIDMVEDILTATVGLRLDNDKSCQAIRSEVFKRVTAANENYKSKSRAYDQIEMSSGGNVERLILQLVNGR